MAKVDDLLQAGPKQIILTIVARLAHSSPPTTANLAVKGITNRLNPESKNARKPKLTPDFLAKSNTCSAQITAMHQSLPNSSRATNYDPVKLHKAICAKQGWRPTLTRFYTGVPSQIESPMWAAYWSNRVLALKRVGVSVTTRPIRYHKEKVVDHNGDPVLNDDGTQKVITVPHEKGIDVRLALDLVSLARKKQFDIALIFSQDQDLQEVVQEIWDIAKEQDRWIKVACAFPSGSNASSERGIDKTEWYRMDKAFYDQHLDPRDYRARTA